jgi:hypothetical protein
MKSRIGRLTCFLLCFGMNAACCAVSVAEAPHADAAFLPPKLDQKNDVANSSGLSADEMLWALDGVGQFHVFSEFEGMNDSLRAKRLDSWSAGFKQGALQGGEIAPASLSAEMLFGEPKQSCGAFYWSSGIASVDARAIRLHVDFSQMPADASAWVLDPERSEAFGPYTSGSGLCWLATIFGEEAVLLVRTSTATIPDVRLVEYSHIFLDVADAAKNLSCNVDIGCESDEEILKVASGTAIIIVGGAWYCSGTLVNNERTEEHEPFFLTANHCICTGQNARDTEAFWDYRASGCETNDAPAIASLSRSTGTALLATNSKLDTTLIRLKSVPVGEYGRTFIGWDAREINKGENVLSLHYPDATRMRISKGTTKDLDIAENGRKHLIETQWDEGVTESGSSGSCLLLSDTLRIVGMLSQGTAPTCGTDRSEYFDFFGNFEKFYSQVSAYIDSESPSIEAGEDDCRDTSSFCFLGNLFENYDATLSSFRTLRDRLNASGALGKRLVDAYYSVTPKLSEALNENGSSRDLLVIALAPLSKVELWLETAERLNRLSK